MMVMTLTALLMQAAQQGLKLEPTGFWEVNLGNTLIFLTVVVAAMAYRFDRRKDNRDRVEAREKMLEEQVRMHTENKMKLESLAAFHTTQDKINIKRDEQIAMLSTQTSTLAQMAKGMERRLELIEDRAQGRRGTSGGTSGGRMKEEG